MLKVHYSPLPLCMKRTIKSSNVLIATGSKEGKRLFLNLKKEREEKKELTNHVMMSGGNCCIAPSLSFTLTLWSFGLGTSISSGDGRIRSAHVWCRAGSSGSPSHCPPHLAPGELHTPRTATLPRAPGASAASHTPGDRRRSRSRSIAGRQGDGTRGSDRRTWPRPLTSAPPAPH